MENKRIWAMVGVVYVVISVFLMTYWIATTSLINGLTGIILFPLCAGLAVQCFNCRWKLLHQRQERGNPTVFLLLGVGCSIATVLALVLGCLELISKFR
ncbi:MAG: hypothetical protein ACI3U8_03680 [Candidatus Onthomonas sp.]